MRRTNGRKLELADAVIISDTHLRDDQPTCRKDDYFWTQLKKLEWVINLLNDPEQVGGSAPLIIAGDVFDYWKPSPLLLAETIRIFQKAKNGHRILAVAGQHDLPNHNLELLNKTGLAVLMKACDFEVITGGTLVPCGNLNIYGWSWGEKLPKEKGTLENPCTPSNRQKQIGLFHFPTWQGIDPYGPNSHIPDAVRRLKSMPWFDLMVVGDNHEPFMQKANHGSLLSPGSLCRMDADQDGHEPCAWLYSSSGLQEMSIPIQPDAVSREHLDSKKERDGKLDAFVSSIGKQKGKKLSFLTRLEVEMSKKEHEQELVDVMNEAMERDEA